MSRNIFRVKQIRKCINLINASFDLANREQCALFQFVIIVHIIMIIAIRRCKVWNKEMPMYCGNRMEQRTGIGRNSTLIEITPSCIDVKTIFPLLWARARTCVVCVCVCVIDSGTQTLHIVERLWLVWLRSWFTFDNIWLKWMFWAFLYIIRSNDFHNRNTFGTYNNNRYFFLNYFVKFHRNIYYQSFAAISNLLCFVWLFELWTSK